MDLLALARIVLLSAVIAISSPNAVPITPAAGNTIYTVQNGDTLSSIARQFKTTADSLQQINHLSSADNLLPGERLQVPAPPAATATAPPAVSAAATYTVKSGDTLASIAASFGVSVSDIAQASGLQNVDAISVGQVLTIPGRAPAPNPVPDGIALDPPIIKQGNTLEFKVTASSVVTATGTFNGRRLLFNQVNGTLFALAGISRCGQPGTYPANITVTNADGTTRTLNFGVKVNATAYPVQDITLTPQMAALLDPAIEIAENNRVANTVTPFTSAPAWSGPFSPPLAAKDKDAIITAVFGNKRSYNGGAPGLCGHEGQDFAIDGGTPVYAPAGGTIVLAEPLKVRGNVVFINHGLGVYSAFFHLSEIDVKDGQVVKQGDLLGKVGTTGFSTGNHLHWSMWVPAGVPDPGLENRQDVYVDPIEWENRTIP